MFSCCVIPSNSKETELGCSSQEVSLSATKTPGLVLEPCHAWVFVPAIFTGGMDIPEFLWCHLCQVSSESHNYFKDDRRI